MALVARKKGLEVDGIDGIDALVMAEDLAVDRVVCPTSDLVVSARTLVTCSTPCLTIRIFQITPTTKTTSLVARAVPRLGAKILSAGQEDVAVVGEAILEARDMAAANPLIMTMMLMESKRRPQGAVQADGDVVVGSEGPRRPVPRDSITGSV
jgi:hypothetical protein